MKLYNTNPIKWLANLCGLAFIALASCADDEMLKQDNNPDAKEGYISFRCSEMLETYTGEQNYASRAGAPKSDKEKEIKSLHVFFFSNDAEGKLLTTGSIGFEPYQKITGKALIKIPKLPDGETLFQEGSSNIHIVALANIDATDEAADYTDLANSFLTSNNPDGKIQAAGRDAGGTPYEITCYDDLRKWVYYPRIRLGADSDIDDITELPAAGMPMIGEFDNGGKGVDLSTKPTEGLIMNLTALMAKVNISVRLEPKQYASDSDFPTLRITEYGIKNMPVAVPYVPCDGSYTGGATGTRKPETYADYLANYNVTSAPMYHSKGTPSVDAEHYECTVEEHEYTTTKGLPITINRDSKAQTFSYYTYENINLPNYAAQKDNEDEDGNDDYYPGDITDGVKPDYPDGVGPDDEQRWKPKIAYENRASALILRGEYTTDQEVTYQAQFTIYMGANSETDFMVKRNHCYDNNIIIEGLDYIRNSTDNVFTFDGRVNVRSDNPLYLSIINERMIDAHATALPMDVWFMLRENAEEPSDVDWTSEVTFTIEDHEKVNWIRMEKVPRWSRNGVVGMEESGWKPGNGARDYFTTDLVTNTLANNWEITVRGGLESDPNADGSRSRIYFYIDENVPTRNDVSEDEYGPRTATVHVKYYRRDKVTGAQLDYRDYTLDIDQKALVKVNGKRFNRNDNYEDVPDTWMEYYEENLEHFDPLDKHEMPGELYTDGLRWGPTGFSCRTHWNGGERAYRSVLGNYINSTRACDYNEVYGATGAVAMTAWMVSNRGDIKKVKLFNFEEPESAFHYAYGKNKRNADGTVPNTNQNRSGGWYLPGIRELEAAITQHYGVFKDFRENFYWSAAPGEEPNNNTNDHARATQVTITGTTPTYTSSSNGYPGFKMRSEICRIRTFYKVP